MMAINQAISAEAAWAAVMNRDRNFDGQFVTGVLTTGIYCRPSCAARHPKRSNVKFFSNGEQAKATGLRPCKRCHPDDVARDEAAVAQALKLIGVALNVPTLDDLAELTGYSPQHFQRLFKKQLGVSPAAYARALRAKRVKQELQDGDQITHAIFDSGFETASRFYGESKPRLGMTPSAWKKGGQGVIIYWSTQSTALGEMLVAMTDKGICRLSFDESSEALTEFFPNAKILPATENQQEWIAAAVSSVAEPSRDFDLPLDVKGTAFQETVWQALRDIPAGETFSYAELAAQVGRPKAVRAVGSACGANKVAVLIPCHRALRSDGSLGGYAYGLDRKKLLLGKESK